MVGRNDKGQFKKGEWKGGPGRKPKVIEGTYLEIMKSAVTSADWLAVAEKAVQQARRGDPQARKWLSDYLMGPPPQDVNLNHSGQIAIPGLAELIAKVYGYSNSGAGGSSSS